MAMEKLVEELNNSHHPYVKFTLGELGDFFTMECNVSLQDMHLDDMRLMLDAAERIVTKYQLTYVMGTMKASNQPESHLQRRFAIQFRRV